MRLRTSRRRRKKLPCTVTVASKLGLFMQPYGVETSKRTKHVFSFLAQCHKVFCDIYFDGSFRDIGLYSVIHHTLYDGNEKQESLIGTQAECNGRSMADCFKRPPQHRYNRGFYKWLVSFLARRGVA